MPSIVVLWLYYSASFVFLKLFLYFLNLRLLDNETAMSKYLNVLNASFTGEAHLPQTEGFFVWTDIKLRLSVGCFLCHTNIRNGLCFLLDHECKKNPRKSQARFSLAKCIALAPVFGFSAGRLSVQTSSTFTSKSKLVWWPRPLKRQVGCSFIQYHLFFWSVHSK